MSTVSPFLSLPRLRSHSKIFIDFPETGPGSILRPSGVIIPPTSTSTGLPRSGGGNSKVGAIAGGIAGGVAAVAIVIAAIFYLRRRSQAPSAGTGAPQPSLPTTIKFYVTCFRALRFPCVSSCAFFYFCTFRTRMTHLRSRTKVVRPCRTSLTKYLCQRTLRLEVPWATRRLRHPRPGDMMAVPCSDLALRNHQESRTNKSSSCLPSSDALCFD